MRLPSERVHLPFEAGPYRMAMGLVAGGGEALVELDDRYPDEMAQRRELLAARRAGVFDAMPGSEAARAEACAAVVADLCARFPHWFRREGALVRNALTGEGFDLDGGMDRLEIAGRLVQEDLCLVRPGDEGPVLTAAVLCFPSRWVLGEKIGRPLAAIHEGVPLYGERLSRPVDRFMTRLGPGRVAARYNWSVLDDPALFQPVAKRDVVSAGAISPEAAGERLFVRVERQTLSALPASGSVLFAIRVHVYPLARVAADAAVAARLASAVRELPAEIQRYKNLAPFRGALLAYLDGASA